MISRGGPNDFQVVRAAIVKLRCIGHTSTVDCAEIRMPIDVGTRRGIC